MSSISQSGLQGALVSEKIGLAVAVKAQDAAKQQGAAAISLLEDAAKLQEQAIATSDPNRGNIVDVIA